MKQLVIIPGGYHPFHAGHKALYDAAVQAFPGASIFLAATNDTSERPFPFKAKQLMANIAGVPQGVLVQVKSPFRAQEITSRVTDAENTQLIFVRSEKDKMTQPIPGGTKKNGDPSYLQPMDKAKNPEAMTKHAYMAYLPTVEFSGGLTSASEIRSSWPSASTLDKQKLITTMYPSTVNNPKLMDLAIRTLDTAIGSGIKEAVITKLDTGEIAIQPDGGMGTYDETTLVLSLAQDLQKCLEHIKYRRYSSAEWILYKAGATQSKVKALADYEAFNEKQGKRPIAKGRSIDITRDKN